MSSDKTIFLLRHAKSSWKNSELSDHDRPLNKRGKLNAAAMSWLLATAVQQKSSVGIQRVLCSTAKRTRETLTRIRALVPSITDDIITYSRALYCADSSQLLDQLCVVDDSLSTVLLIGHNPGISDLADQLCDEAIEPLVTCQIIGISLPIQSWKQLYITRGKLCTNVSPRRDLQ